MTSQPATTSAPVAPANPAPAALAIGDVPTHVLFGVPVAAANMNQAVAICRQALQDRRQLIVGALNAAKVVDLHHHRVLRDAVLASDVIFADGMAVVWASRLFRKSLPERVAGIDLFDRLLEVAADEGYGVYLLGARQEVLDHLIERLLQRLPRLRICGARNGYFNDADSDAITDEINASGADMLFLGITSPKKEIFFASQAARLKPCICHGVGGSFDVFADKVQRAPLGWQKLGLEWFYRLYQEPRRLWRRYLVTNTLFVLSTIREFFRPEPPLKR